MIAKIDKIQNKTSLQDIRTGDQNDVQNPSSTSQDHLRFLHNGRETYPSMLEAIASARKTVHLETYIFRSDATGRLFAEALKERVRAGVTVRFICDAFGVRHEDPCLLQDMRDNGVQVHVYHTSLPWKQGWGWWRRTHRKLLIIDGQVGFTGGLNISDEYADPLQGGDGWRDVHARVEGPTASVLDALFVDLWNQERPGDQIPAVTPSRDSSGRIRVVANEGLFWRDRIHKEISAEIRGAQTRITIAMGYFLPGIGLRADLYAAAVRGVEVRILTPTRVPLPSLMHAAQTYYREYIERGLHLYRHTDTILHAKTIVVDGSWCAVGSFNVTARSRYHNLDANLHIRDSVLARELEEALNVDFCRAKRITAQKWEKLALRSPWLDRWCWFWKGWY